MQTMTIWTWCSECWDRHEFYETVREGNSILFASKVCHKSFVRQVVSSDKCTCVSADSGDRETHGKNLCNYCGFERR